MLKNILIGIGIVVGGFLIYVATLPSHGIISRDILIDASPEKIFPYINTRSLANSWNPWFRKDLQAKITFQGPEEGVGAQTLWESGKELGTGSATVVQSILNEKVVVRLEYKEPFQMVQDATYTLRAEGTQTRVEWRVEGETPFVLRLFCVFINMDKIVGDIFAQGLVELKTMVETKK